MAASTRETVKSEGGSKQFVPKSQLAKHAYYEQVLDLTRQNQSAILLDVGCFSEHEHKHKLNAKLISCPLFRGIAGTDLRKLVSDGWPPYRAIGIDTKQAWIDLGFRQYADRDESQITFVVGDVLDLTSRWTPQAGTAAGLASLKKPFKCISVFSFFHLFDEDDQLKLAGRLADLLSCAPGSVILGAHRMKPTAGRCENSRIGSIFCHSPESWRSLWEETVFPPKLGLRVRVDVKFVNGNPVGETDEMMEWSVVVAPRP